MNPTYFAEWMRRQGRRVVQTESTYWYEASSRVYQAFPYHWLIHPSEQELDHFLRANGAIALRYSTRVDAPAGMLSYHAVYEKPTYQIEDLDRRSRQNIHHGLKNCRVEQISLERLAEDGWELEDDTVDRQQRGTPMRKAAWQRRCLAAAELPGFEAWAAIVDGRLAATLLSFQMDDCCELISQQCKRDFLPARVNNALTYIVTETMTRRPGIRSIFYTLQSLDAPPTVDEFKFRMGYEPKPVRQRVEFNPLLRPLVNASTQAGMAWLRRKFSDSESLAKAEGMFRFYLEGKKDLDCQPCPPCLETYRSSLRSPQPA